MGNQIAAGPILYQLQNHASDIAMSDIRKVDLNLLVVLDALLDERNVTRAAARLGYTQPTISGMLTRLRRPLWRSPVRAYPARLAADTARGGARSSVEAIARRQPASRGPRHLRTGRCRADLHHIEQRLHATRSPRTVHQGAEERSKHIQLAIAPPMIEGLGDTLARGQVDLASRFPSWRCPICRHGCCTGSAMSSPFARASARAPRDDDRRALLQLRSRTGVPTGGSFEGPTDQALARLRLRRKVRYSVPSFLLVPDILLTDDLVALVPSRLLRSNHKRLAVLKPPIGFRDST